MINLFSKFTSAAAAFLVVAVLAFIGFFLASQYVTNTDVCTVKSTADIIKPNGRTHMYRVNTEECGTFSFSAVPLRGVSSSEARQMFERINLGEQYEFVYIVEGFGVFTKHASVLDFRPANR